MQFKTTFWRPGHRISAATSWLAPGRKMKGSLKIVTPLDRFRIRQGFRKGPSTQYSYTYPKLVLYVLLPNTQVPNYWVLGPLGFAEGHGGWSSVAVSSKIARYKTAGRERCQLTREMAGFSERSQDACRILFRIHVTL